MPLTPIKYENGLIYKIVCSDPSITDCYIGSTTNIMKRKQAHKRNCINEKSKDYNIYLYQFIRENGNWDNWNLVLIEYYPCNNKLELEKQERFYIEELKATLNKQIPLRSKKEWIEDNKDKIKEQTKKYYENNEEKIKKYYKEYIELNKEKLKEYNKKKYERNKEQTLQQQKLKITCGCGCVVNKGCLERHKKSNKHNNLMKTN